MVEIRLGDRYAKSIYELAVERKEVDAVRDDFQLIAKVCKQNPDFRLMLSSPVVSTEKKKAVITEVFKDKLSTITDNLLQIIVRKKREKFIPDIAEQFLALYDLRHNMMRGTLVSAAPLTDSQVQAIIDVVKKELNTDFELEQKVDPELIGGFTLRVGDRLFDGSIANRLQDLENQFKHNPYVK